jgi:alpha/beta superfamily hydrolase
MKEENVRLQCQEYNLSAVRTLPEDGTLSPTVVMCHGRSRDKNGTKYKILSEELAKNGISSLRFDFYGHGESDGVFNDFTESIGVKNLHHVIKYLQNNGCKNNSIGISGSSTGAQVAILYAVRNPEIGALVLRAPAYDYESLRIAEYIQSPTLIITGEKDTLVSPTDAKKLYDRFICKKEFRVIKGATHECQDINHIMELNRLNAEWFERWLK